MPRVLLTGFCAVPGPRRAGVQLRHVIRALTPMHTVDLLVVREGEQAYVERQGSVRVLRVPTHEAGLAAQIQAFQRALRRQLDGADYDVVHCRDSWSCMPVLEARARLGYAVVYDLARGPIGESTGDAELDAQYQRDEEACLLAADLVLAPTPAAVRALDQRGTPGRTLLSPPGVDVDRFDWDELPADEPPRVLHVGALDARGLRVLLRGFAAVVRERDARLVLAGPLAPGLELGFGTLVRDLGLAAKVDRLGPIDHDQLPALYATASVCVVPSAQDGRAGDARTTIFPTRLLEYMACKRAIVAPRCATVEQVVYGNHEALLFEPDNPVDFARQVLRVLGEPMIRDRLAANAYERVRREMTASGARRAVRKAYDVLARRFAGLAARAADDDEAPKVELLSDDDFEATVFEEAPAPGARGKVVHLPPEVDTSVSAVRIEVGAIDDADSSSNTVAPPPAPDQTVERAPVVVAPPSPLRAIPRAPARPANGGGDHTATLGAGGKDDWVVTTVARLPAPLGAAPRRSTPRIEREDRDDADDGTPLEGVAPAPPPPGLADVFVAGEIDVPSATTSAAPPDDLASIEFNAAGSLLAGSTVLSDNDPDTGSRTPPIERR